MRELTDFGRVVYLVEESKTKEKIQKEVEPTDGFLVIVEDMRVLAEKAKAGVETIVKDIKEAHDSSKGSEWWMHVNDDGKADLYPIPTKHNIEKTFSEKGTWNHIPDNVKKAITENIPARDKEAMDSLFEILGEQRKKALIEKKEEG